MPTAVITGTNRGIGLEFVRRYLESGWNVIALNRNDSPAITDLSVNPNLTVLHGDLTREEDLERMAAALGETSIDLLINNAGIMGSGAFRTEGHPSQGLHDFDRREWREVMEINLFTPMQLIALLRPQFANGARIVTISSSMGSTADNQFGGWYAYRASKAAVNSLMKSVSLELGDAVIAIALHPGWVRTDMGGAGADIDASTSAEGMIRVIEGLKPADSGSFLAFDGRVLPY